MRSVVDLEIASPPDVVAQLYADPRNNPAWMDDLDRYEPVSGEQGMPGSQYRLVSKDGDMTFLATVLSRDLPRYVSLRLDSRGVAVDISVHLDRLPSGSTRFVSTEDFHFKGLRRFFGLLARRQIKSAHRRHMVAFKHFAESDAAAASPRSIG